MYEVLEAINSLMLRVAEYVNRWTQYQALWDLQPDVLYERLGDELQNWMTVVKEVKAARSMVDTQESEFEVAVFYQPRSLSIPILCLDIPLHHRLYKGPNQNLGQVRVLAERGIAEVRHTARYASFFRQYLYLYSLCTYRHQYAEVLRGNLEVEV